MAPEPIKTTWQKFVDNFIGASATVILGGIVAFVSGFMQKIDKIADTQVLQSAEVKQLAIRFDERDKAVREAQMRSVEMDAALKAQIDHFGAQHDIMLRELVRVKDEAGKRR